ncbi:MAG TPA: ankyrin repeat domain-containing protein [Candidatus Limnocylindria bacterium]|nr:ankyrin repeat domain-containing protein [Candidatus Limnocylindria bacterium]
MSGEELFAAIAGHDQAAVERILAADPAAAAAVDANGVSALLTAAYHGNDAAAAAIRATGHELNVFEAAAVGDLARIRALVDADPALARAVAPDGFQPLGLAAFFGHSSVVSFLIAAGADVSAPSRNRMSVTALHSAIAGRDRASALALIAAGADVNAKQQDDFTALHEAAQNGDREIVDALLAAGADPSLTLSKSGERPADLARTHGHPEIAQVLEQAPPGSG